MITILASTSEPIPSEILFIPVGETLLQATTVDGAGYSGKILCNYDTFVAIRDSFDKMRAAGERCWIDFSHKDEAAAGDITGFRFDPARGVLATVRWTSAGAQALRDKSYTQFSPAFMVERFSGRVTGLLRGMASGGIVNNPAFSSRSMQLVAARAFAGDGSEEDAETLARVREYELSAAKGDFIGAAVRANHFDGMPGSEYGHFINT